MPTIIAVTNQKGGVGKTTTAACLAFGLASKKQRVLCIDLDPQGNLGFCLGLDAENNQTIHDVFLGLIPLKEAILPTEFCDIIPSDISLSAAELEFNISGRESLLKNAIASIQDDYDYIIIDTPPALNILTVNAYVVADHLIIPMSPEILSLMGVSQIKETIDSVRSSFNPQLDILGILLTKYNKRTLLAREVEDMAASIATPLNTVVFETRIRNGVAAAEAPAHGESVQAYAPRSNPGKDYTTFINEICNRLQIK